MILQISSYPVTLFLGCFSIGGFEVENEDYCWTCENMYGPGKHTSGDSIKPLYYKDEDIDNTYWNLFDNEGKWICFELYANNIDHTTKFWIDGEWKYYPSLGPLFLFLN